MDKYWLGILQLQNLNQQLPLVLHLSQQISQMLVTVQQQDFRETDLSEADLVILYLTTRTLFQLSDKLRELPVGARIVTHDFALPGWKISEQTTFDSVESGRCFELFLYVQD